MLHLDTNFLIAALISGTPQEARLLQSFQTEDVVTISAVTWGEFLCGPTSPEEVELAKQTFPHPEPLTAANAARGAELFNATGRRPGSFVDCLIAAAAIDAGAALATLNLDDFRRFEPHGLRLLSA